MKEERTVRHDVPVDGASIAIRHPEEGDIVDVTDVERLEVTLTTRSEGYDEIHITTVPERKGQSDEATIYVEGDAEMLGRLSDAFSIAYTNAQDAV